MHVLHERRGPLQPEIRIYRDAHLWRVLVVFFLVPPLDDPPGSPRVNQVLLFLSPVHQQRLVPHYAHAAQNLVPGNVSVNHIVLSSTLVNRKTDAGHSFYTSATTCKRASVSQPNDRDRTGYATSPNPMQTHPKTSSAAVRLDASALRLSIDRCIHTRHKTLCGTYIPVHTQCSPLGVVLYQEVLLGFDGVKVETHRGPVERQRPGVLVGDHVLGREIQVPFQFLKACQQVGSGQVRSGNAGQDFIGNGRTQQ